MNSAEFELLPTMRAESRTRHELSELATRQHGVVSQRQMRSLGYSASAIDREVQSGGLHRLHQGVYAVGHRAISRQGICFAAVLTCGDDSLLSHTSAAWLWGLTRSWSAVLHVTAASVRSSRPGIRIHSSTRLLEDDRGRCEGVPATAVPRTLLDLAAVRPRWLEGALQSAERLDLLDLGAIEALLLRSRGVRGAARLRDALAPYRIPAFTRSGVERRFLELVRRAGIPRPSTNLFVEGYELDAYWPDLRFAVELDTYDYHGGQVAFEEDRLRQEELKLAGIEMVRITGVRLDREPAVVMRRLRQLLEMRRRVRLSAHLSGKKSNSARSAHSRG